VTASALELFGIVVACGAAAAALVLDDRRLRQGAMVIALMAAPVIVLGDVWDEARVVDFRHSPAQVGGALVVGAIALVVLAAAFRRRPQWFASAAFAVLPLRVPVEIGGETANLLVPLYLVIASGLLASILSSEQRATHSEQRSPWPARLRWLLAATVVLYAIQSSYSADVANAIENIGFFLVPFAVLSVLVLEVEWNRALARTVLIAVGVVAVGCAAIGIYQYLARDLFLNPELFDANELHVYFRVNSIFFDPNVFGRYLALAITAFAACIAWGGNRRDLTLASLVCALCLVALALSYSITSCASLLAGLGIVAILRWRWHGAVAYGALGLAGLAALAIAGGTPTSDIQDVRSIDAGHSDLIKGGLALAGVLDDEDARDQGDIGRPIAGYGSGSFGRAFFEHIEQARTTVSHSEPVTVAAEQGAIGLLVYVGLLVAALATLLGGHPGRSLTRIVAAACFVAIVVDSFGYTGFVIDPATWALLGLGIAVRGDPPEGSTTIRV
jgi:putative inorganic carbon (HCO3(-)) transporter